jgi:hypothetical protein
MKARFTGTAFFVTGGLLVWAADFLFLYVFAALSCERGFAHHFGSVSITANLLAGGATIAIFFAARPKREFGARLASIIATLSLIAIVFLAIPGLLLDRSC